MRFFPTYTDYKIVGGAPVLRIAGRDENGGRVIKLLSGVESYGYCKKGQEVGVHDPRIKRFEPAPPSLYGEETVKFVTRIPADVSGHDPLMFYVKDNFKDVYETDILFANRCKIDLKINGAVETPNKTFIGKFDIAPSKNQKKILLRTQFLDIESIGGSIQDAIDGKAKIPCLTVYDNFLNTYTLFTTIPVTLQDELVIKQKIVDFWLGSFTKLKESIKTETNTEKQAIITSQIKYMEKNIDRITRFSLTVLQFPSNEDMMMGYINFCRDTKPDVQCGWNSLKFDSPAILNTIKNMNLPHTLLSDLGNAFVTKEGEAVIDGLVLLDLMDRYVKMQQATPSHRSLDFIAKKELGIGKFTGGYELYNTDLTAFLAYNVVDVQLCVELDTLLHIMDFYVEMATLTNSNLSDVNKNQYIDNLILSFVNGIKVLPTRARIEAEPMSGAVVYVPVPGLHKYVIILDFKGMYPSIMKSLNISIETKDPNGDIVAANGVRFNSKIIGIIPTILFELDKKRAYYKGLQKQCELNGDKMGEKENDLKQYAVKVIQNSFYGVMGYKKFRLADRDVGDSVTSTGRTLSMATKAFVEGLGLNIKVIYGDTDSLFIEMLDDVVTYDQITKLGKELCDKINVFIPTFMKEKFNVPICYAQIEDDAPYRSLIMLPKKQKSKDEDEQSAKKRYAGYKWKKENVFEFKAKGVELVKGNVADITRYVQSNVLKMLLNESKNDEIFAFLRDTYVKFYDGSTPIESIGRPGSLRKEISEYTSDIPIKRGCEYANHHLGKAFKVNSSFMLYYINSGQTDVLCLDFGEPIPRSFSIDMNTTWKKLVEEPVETMIATRNIKWSNIISNSEDIPIDDSCYIFAEQ